MNTRRKLIVAIAAILLLGLLSAHVNAQDQLPVKVLTLHFIAVPSEPPTIEQGSDLQVFKINPVGAVTGDLEGTLSQRITQVGPSSADPIIPVNQSEQITTFFTIETAEGKIEGYYAGAFYFPTASYPDATVYQRGQVLSVTAAYADLYLAEVYYDGIVDFEEIDGASVGVGDSGTLVIAPR